MAKAKANAKAPTKKAKKKAAAPPSAKSTVPGWDAIAAVVGASRAKLGIPIPDAFELPSIDVEIAVRALHLELGKAKLNGITELLRSLLEIEGSALDMLAEHLARQWLDSDRDAAARWMLEAAGAIGGERTASLLGAFIADKLRDATAHHQITAVAEALWRMTTPSAAHEILMLAELPSRYVKRRDEARALFQEVAKRSKLSPHELALRCAPRDADPAWRDRIEMVWARRCERMMVDGVRLAFGDVKQSVLDHPIRGPLTARMVLGTCNSDKQITASFRPSRKGPVDAGGAPVVIADDAVVGFAHPVELDAIGELDAWRGALADQGAAQPFVQLERTIHRMTARQASGNELRDFRWFDREWLHAQGWEARKVDVDWAGDADTFVVTFARDNRQVVCRLAGDGSVQSVFIGHTDRFGRTQPDETTFGALHPVSQSELLYAFLKQRDASAPRPAAAVPRSRYPFAELARSSRSACLQCGKKIEKATVRVVIEREVDSDTFRGKSDGYLHAACAARHESLAGVPDLDARIAANSQIAWPPA